MSNEDPDWGRVLAAMERSHPCFCGGTCTSVDAQPGRTFGQRMRLHMGSCPKRKMLDVLTAAWRELGEDDGGR